MSIELAYQQLSQALESIYSKREGATIANWVMEHVTGLKRMDRILHKNESLTPEQAESFADKTNQLFAGKPVQYVLGEAWFAGNAFYVDEAVLIPRPETEELIEWILLDDQKKDFRHFLDIGTGSGCIPITLHLKKPSAKVQSCDISSDALAIAKKMRPNFRQLLIS